MFAPWGPKNVEMARFGPSMGKIELPAVKPPKFQLFHPLESFGLINKLLAKAPFFAKNPFSTADEFVFTGLVVQSCHNDITACNKAHQLAQKG